MSEGQQKILVIDDDPHVSWSLGRFFTRSGYDVAACGDGLDAVDLLKTKAFDFVITDVQLPHLNGLAVLEWVRQNRPGTSVMVITAHGSPAVRRASIAAGATHYIEKPVDPEVVLRILRSIDLAEDDGWRGRVDRINLFDYLQLLLLAGHCNVLEITSKSGRRGRIYIAAGQVRHAECSGLVGEEAFYRCLAFEGGSFCTLPWQEPAVCTVNQRGDFMLLEAARLKAAAARAAAGSQRLQADEGQASPESAPCPDSLDALDAVFSDTGTERGKAFGGAGEEET